MKQFGIQLHITRTEAGEMIEQWCNGYNLSWFECQQNIHDLEYGKEADLSSLLSKNRLLRLLLIQKPIPKSFRPDVHFLAKNTRKPSYAVFDVGRELRIGLEESHFSGQIDETWKAIVQDLKKRTLCGVRLKGDSRVHKQHRYTAGAMELSDRGTAMVDIAGGELELVK
jgi:hypothetical protein